MAMGGPRPWRDFFDDVTLARGLAYQRDGRVLSVDVMDDSDLIAVVRGSKRYRVAVTLVEVEERREGLFLGDVQGRCSCPLGGYCKHLAAAIAQYSRQRGLPVVLPRVAATTVVDAAAELAVDATAGTTADDQPTEPTEPTEPTQAEVALPSDLIDVHRVEAPEERAVSEWLGWIHGQVGAAPPADHHLGWIIAPTPDGRSLVVETVLLGRRKLKAFGIIKRYDHGIDHLIRQPPAVASSADLALIQVLANAGGAYARHARLSGLIGGGLVLDRLIATNRAFWNDVGTAALVSGEAVGGAAAWVDEDGGHRLEVHADDGRHWQVLPVDPPRYRRAGVIGTARIDLPAAVLAAIVRMPTLDTGALAAAAPALARLLPGLPLPVQPTVTRPEPWLTVMNVPVVDQWGYGWPKPSVDGEVALVWFRYPQGAVPPGGSALLRIGAEVLVRDLAAEQACLAALVRAGFVPLAERPRLEAKLPKEAKRLPAWAHRPSLDAANAGARIKELLPFVLPRPALAALVAAGWKVAGDATAVPRIVDAGEWFARVDEGDAAATGGKQDWFELHLGIQVGDERIELAPLLAGLIAGGRAAITALPRPIDDEQHVLMALPDGRLLRVALDHLLRIHDHLIELFDVPPGPGGGLRVEAAQALLALECDALSPRWLGGAKLRGLAEQLQAAATPPPVAPPAGLKAELRPYQRDGLAWLQHLRALGLGGLLADDMGLGKTVQTIAHLLVEQDAGRLDRPALVVCPASVVGTWARELERFAPTLRVLVLHGLTRERDPAAIAGHHVLITSYGTLLRDRDLLAGIPLHLVVCDEAQALKNITAKAGDAVRGLDSRHRLCLTGTPVENHLGELYALISWLAPGLLGAGKTFERVFRRPIEKDGDRARQDLLRRRLAPVMLRRTKEAVAKDLPAKTESVIAVDLNPGQRVLYESIRLAMDAEVRKAIEAKGLKRSQIEVLAALLKLRQVCCDPRLVKGTAGAKAGPSAKLEALADLLPALIEDGRRVLLFSQFTTMLDRIEEDVVKPLGIEWLRLDGSTAKRQPLIERFQRGEVPLFLLSLKAGGVGLTLTAADTVIHYDPWWNPAAEEQATDRAHRIGQDKPVFVYRLVCSGTVEERIRGLQERKRALAAGVYGDDGQAGGALSAEDIAALFAPLPE